MSSEFSIKSSVGIFLPIPDRNRSLYACKSTLPSQIISFGFPYIALLVGIQYYEIEYHFGGENMVVFAMEPEVANMLSSIGIFFAGLGILFLSFGLFWAVDVYSKKNKQSKQKEEK